jgi:hypothetical protein
LRNTNQPSITWNFGEELLVALVLGPLGFWGRNHARCHGLERRKLLQVCVADVEVLEDGGLEAEVKVCEYFLVRFEQFEPQTVELHADDGVNLEVEERSEL